MKKQIPLIIHQTFAPIAANYLHLIKPILDDGCLFSVVDRDEKSDFFFRISTQKKQAGKDTTYTIAYKPRSEIIINDFAVGASLEGAVNIFEKWIKLIHDYNNTQTFYDDPILQAYQKEFEEKFKSVDDDSDTAPFTLEQQLYLDDYLERTENKLESLKEGKDQEMQKQIGELQRDVGNIRLNITRETKKKIVERLSKFWSKSRKMGLDILREVFVNVMQELSKKLLNN